MVIAAPEEYKPRQDLMEKNLGPGKCSWTKCVREAMQDADFVYTDVWVSMGEPEEVWAERIAALSPYKVTKVIMKKAGKQAIFMHCLPAFHDLGTDIGKKVAQDYGFTELEVEDSVFESEQSVVFDEAENRLHTIKAVMAATLGYKM